ncbi:VWA domain-containing protein, partial [Clostridium perfringens]|nr:VWA domain-containing protein [Clostridium perfringens]
MQRKINGLLVLFSLIGGAVGFASGEYVLHSLIDDMPTIFIVGIYMGILALSIGLFCLIAEMISPRLSGSSWRQQYTGLSWKLLVPATLVLLLVLGTVLEFVYELNMGGVKQVKDI